LVQEAINDSECSSKDLIIDPFVGSGTVSVVAALSGVPSVGFEVNPFLAFLSKAKLQQCAPDLVDRWCSKLHQEIEKGEKSELEGFSTFSWSCGLDKWLFNRGVLRAFRGGWQSTLDIPTPVAELFRLALMGAALDTCNATRDGKCLRYRKNWRQLKFDGKDFLSAFDKRIEVIRNDLEKCPIKGGISKVLRADIRGALQKGLSRLFKLCVTSPPYLNSFDYSDVYRPELFLGGFVKNNKDLRRVRLQTVRSHVQIKWEPPTMTTFGPLYNEAVARIREHKNLLWDHRLLTMIQAYFEDISGVLKNLRTFAQSDASLWLIVSTSAYAGVEIPVDLIIADIGVQVGWSLREVDVLRHLRSSGQCLNIACRDSDNTLRLRESVVILDAQPKK
jgi:hypothetical protein